jgi:hypothetical protein
MIEKYNLIKKQKDGTESIENLINLFSFHLMDQVFGRTI